MHKILVGSGESGNPDPLNKVEGNMSGIKSIIIYFCILVGTLIYVGLAIEALESRMAHNQGESVVEWDRIEFQPPLKVTGESKEFKGCNIVSFKESMNSLDIYATDRSASTKEQCLMFSVFPKIKANIWYEIHDGLPGILIDPDLNAWICRAVKIVKFPSVITSMSMTGRNAECSQFEKMPKVELNKWYYVEEI